MLLEKFRKLSFEALASIDLRVATLDFFLFFLMVPSFFWGSRDPDSWSAFVLMFDSGLLMMSWF